MKPLAAIAVFGFFTVFHPFITDAPLAQWQPDGAPVCTESHEQLYASIVADGTGGAIVTWSDFRSGTHYDIFAQRLDASGVPQWTVDGVALCTAANDQIAPTIMADGTGGAIITWNDRRSGNNDIFAQRVNAAGTTLWTANGVALCIAANDQSSPKLVSDGAGGAIVAWDDDRTGGFSPDVYVQRVNAAGVAQWAPNGVVLVLQGNDQWGSAIDSDGAGGAVVTWHDYRFGTNYDIFAQRVSASGTPLWTVDGVAICIEEIDQSFPTIASDGSGGAFVTWADPRDGDLDIYGQRVNAAGATQWTVDGIGLCTAAGGQSGPALVEDGAGGVIITWNDSRNGAADIYVQRVNAAGAALWAPDGVELCAASNHQTTSTLVDDGAGGAIVAWQDFRSGVADIYAQRVSASGAPQWADDGVAVCAASGIQSAPAISPGGVGVAFVTWYDYREPSDADIYAQRVVDPPTVAGDSPPLVAVTVLPNYPNPFTSTTELEIGIVKASAIEIDVFDVAGRKVRTQTFAQRSAGWRKLVFDGRDEMGRLLPSGVYFYRVRASGTAVVRKMVIVR